MTVDELLAAALSPFGHSAEQARRDGAVAELLAAHPDEARVRLTDALRQSPDGLQAPAILELLPLFGGADSVPVIETALGSADEMVVQYAGVALGRHPDPGALDALRRALASPSERVAAAAANGARVRGGTELCEPLRARLADPSATVRYHVVHALLTCGCFGTGELPALADREPDADVRALLADDQ